LPAGPLVERVIDLLLGVTDGPGLDVELRARRRRIIQAHPDLMQRHFLHMGKMLGPLTEAVSTLLQRAGGTDAEADGDTRAQAEVMLMMCGAALRAQSLEFARAGADLTSD